MVVRIEGLVIVSTYFSPNRTLRSFGNYIRRVEACVERFRGHDLLVGGDLNARSTAWGDRLTCPRGELVEAWADSLDLSLLNKGRVQTCIKGSGGSVVDVT